MPDLLDDVLARLMARLPEIRPEKTRRIVQIAIGQDGGSDYGETVLALCNDGSLWVLVWAKQPGGERWARLNDIPQD